MIMIKRKLLSAVLASAMIVSLAGCGGASSAPTQTAAGTTEAAGAGTTAAPSGDTAASADQAPAALDTVTMLVNYKATEAPAADNPIILAIKEHTGTTLDVMWVPQDAFEEKINTLMASQQLPMVTVIREIKSSGFINAARSGMFWDLSPYIGQFKNLSQLDENVMKNVQTDGQQFLIPRVRQTARMGGIVRTDWLENLGMEMPTTIDELHDVLYAFTYNDPDKNGINDTFGLSMNDTELKNDSTLLTVYMGGCNEWQVNEDGSFTSKYETDTYTKALTILHDWYAEGLINNDFPINDDELSNFTSGRAGMMWLGNLEDASTRMSNLTEINPDATVDIFQILTEEPGGDQHIVGFRGYTGCIAIPTTSVKTEEELLSVLAFLDKLGDPEMCDLFNYGIEGESYTVVDGGVSQTEDQQLVYGTRYNQLRQITPFYTSTNLLPSSMTPLAEKINSLMSTNTAYTIFDPTLPFISQTETETGGTTGELATFIQDACTNYVIGEITLDDYLASVEKWKSMGGTQIAQEFAEQYAAAQGAN